MQVKAFYGVTQGCNGATLSVARQDAPGPGVSTSNLDSTRTRIVRRGCVVEFPGGATARVERVRLGWFWVSDFLNGHAVGYSWGWPCRRVKVVA